MTEEGMMPQGGEKEEITQEEVAQTEEVQEEKKVFPEEYVKELRREAARYRAERNELKEKLEQALKEAEEAKGNSSSASVELQEARIKIGIYDELYKRGVLHVGAAFKLCDISDLEFSEEGFPTPDSIKKVVDAAEKEYPWLFSAGIPAPGVRVEQNESALTFDSWIRQNLKNRR